MLDVIFGKHFNIGGREVYEDRVAVAEFTTRSGLNLSVALVADGVGGRDKGERAAQVAVDAILRYMPESSDMDVPMLLARAIGIANREVYHEAQSEGREGMATTVAMAAILDQRLLFIANVGDSRIYLCRRNKLTQLTMDHTFANVMVWRGRMTPEQAAKHPRAGVVMRALGVQEQVQVDRGFYVGTDNYGIANERGRQGLPIEPGDAVLVCTDGLVKRSPRSGEWLIKEDEIITVLSSEEGDKAARTLVAFALGREPDDNISVALLQMPDVAREGRKKRRRVLGWVGIVAGALALITLLGVMLLNLRRATGELSDVAATATRIAFEETAMAEIVSAYTPTPILPTTTPRPALITGEVGALFGDSTRTPLIEQQVVSTGSELALVVVNHREDLADGNDGKIYIFNGSTLALDSVTDDRFTVSLSEGSNVLILTGRYSGGVRIRLEPSSVTFTVQGSCMALEPADSANPSLVVASCYVGNCSYVASFGSDPLPIETGQQLIFDVQNQVAISQAAIQQRGAVEHFTHLATYGEGGRADGLACLGQYLPPPPTSTPIVIPTFTPEAGADTDIPAGQEQTPATFEPAAGTAPPEPAATTLSPGMQEPTPQETGGAPAPPEQQITPAITEQEVTPALP